MMKRYEDETWSQFLDPARGVLDPRFSDPTGALLEDLDLVRCTVRGGGLGNKARTPAERTIVRRVRATACIVSVRIGPVLFEDVEIDGLRTVGNPVWVRAGLFHHVVLKGKIGSLSLTNVRRLVITPTVEIEQEQAAFDASAMKFYASMDWAIDISEARFRELDWRLNVPARLVRRDPVTQIVVTRERALEGTWRKIPLHPTLSISLDMFVRSEHLDTILIAAKAASYYKDQLDGIQRLRDAGIAEPE
jgi:hypothetical protein